MPKVLMVCMANVCRSPMACVVAQTLAKQVFPPPTRLQALLGKMPITFDAAGTHAARQGERADPRVQATLERRGYPVSKARSRRIAPRDFERFDLLLAMDLSTLAELKNQCPPEHLGKLHLFLDFSPQLKGQEIPDPYFGNQQGFEKVLDFCEAGAKALLQAMQSDLAQPAGR